MWQSSIYPDIQSNAIDTVGWFITLTFIFSFPCSKTVSGIANLTANVTINMTDLVNSSNISSNLTEDMIDLSSLVDPSNMTDPSNGTMEYFCFGHVTKTQAYYIFLVRE